MQVFLREGFISLQLKHANVAEFCGFAQVEFTMRTELPCLISPWRRLPNLSEFLQDEELLMDHNLGNVRHDMVSELP
jgi:hypothetical protein